MFRFLILTVFFYHLAASQTTESSESKSAEAKSVFHPPESGFPPRGYPPQHPLPGPVVPPHSPLNLPFRPNTYSSPVVPPWSSPLRPPGYGNVDQHPQPVSPQQQQQHPPAQRPAAQAPPMMSITNTEVHCHGTTMQVQFSFSVPFRGLIYPYGHFGKCPLFEGRGERTVSLTLAHGVCGNQKAGSNGVPLNPHMEHRLMVQWDPELVEEWDSSVIVRCDRPQDYNKTIDFDLGTRDLKSDVYGGRHASPQMVMHIEKGEGPGAPPLNGAVYLGQSLTLVFTLSHEYFLFDSHVLDCWAFDGKSERPADGSSGGARPLSHAYGGQQSSLRRFSGEMQVVLDGCSVRPKVFGHFRKTPYTPGSSGGGHTVTQYVHFKAFRFPTSEHISLQCGVQVCFRSCPPQRSCEQTYRPRRSLDDDQEAFSSGSVPDDEYRPDDQSVKMVREIRVLLSDLPEEEELDARPSTTRSYVGVDGYSGGRDCSISTLSIFIVLVALLLSILLLAMIWLKFRQRVGNTPRASMVTPTK